MKTLDEVINELHYWDTCDEFPESFYDFEVTRDALHYLKQYKNTDENYKRAISHVTGVIDHYEKMVADYLSVNNPPLTWDELREMEGKPVFLEQYWYPMEDEEGVTEDEVEIDKYWAIIDNVQAKRIHFVGKRLIMGMTISDLDPNKSGGWQAYRKERE